MKKQKRYTHTRDKTANPKYIRPKSAHGNKRYFIIATLSVNNDIHIELTNDRQKALFFVKNGGKVIFIKTLKDKRRITELSNIYVQKYNHQPADVFESLDNITI